MYVKYVRPPVCMEKPDFYQINFYLVSYLIFLLEIVNPILVKVSENKGNHLNTYVHLCYLPAAGPYNWNRDLCMVRGKAQGSSQFIMLRSNVSLASVPASQRTQSVAIMKIQHDQLSIWDLRSFRILCVEYQRSADLAHAPTEAWNHDCQSAAKIHRKLLVCIAYNMERHAEMLNVHGCVSSGQ